MRRVPATEQARVRDPRVAIGNRERSMSKFSAIRIASAGVIAIAVYAYYLTLGYPWGAAILPRILLVLLILCAGGLLYRGPGPDGVGQTMGMKNGGRVLLGSVLCIGYVLGIHGLGYYLASFLFVIVLALVLRYRKPLYIAIASIGYPLAIYAIFEMMLKIPMPMPNWF